VCGGALTLNDDGTVSIPKGPGIGVTVDVDFVEAHRVN
jgi:L-alanine-DL-glutamate epimerase-like enolase superfamily enzyme